MYKLSINGKSHSVDVPADMPLLWVIRDVVGLKGTKFGCARLRRLNSNDWSFSSAAC